MLYFEVGMYTIYSFTVNAVRYTYVLYGVTTVLSRIVLLLRTVRSTPHVGRRFGDWNLESTVEAMYSSYRWHKTFPGALYVLYRTSMYLTREVSPSLD